MTDDVADGLKNTGLKVTLPRLRVLDVLRTSAQRHLSAESIYRHLLADHADMGLATVYRVLAQFEQAGLVKRNQLGAHGAVYELNNGERHHGHLVCNVTGEVREFYDPEIDRRLQDIAAGMGFGLSDYVMTAYGTPTPPAP